MKRLNFAMLVLILCVALSILILNAVPVISTPPAPPNSVPETPHYTIKGFDTHNQWEYHTNYYKVVDGFVWFHDQDGNNYRLPLTSVSWIQGGKSPEEELGGKTISEDK